MRIRQSETIKAHTVEIEMPFYENESGVVMWGRSDSVYEKNLLIQPDVAFFDRRGNPTLLIELVATHKPDDEKLAKLNRLGINTVLVRLPKGTEEEIEETFAVSSSTRWAYHYENKTPNTYQFPQEIRTTYLRLMSSKESFLKKLSNAERQRLETYYAQLKSAWEENITEQLKEDLEAIYQELRELQMEKASNCREYETQYEKDLMNRLEIDEAQLKIDEEHYQKRKADCINDIRQREERLVSKTRKLRNKQLWLRKRSSQQLKDLEAARGLIESKEKKLTQKRNKLNETSRLRKAEERAYNRNRKDYEESLNLLNEQLEQTQNNAIKEERAKLTEDERILEMNRRRCQDDVNKKKETLRQQSLTTLQVPLNAYKEELLTGISNCPTDIINYLKREEFSAIMRLDSALRKDLPELEEALNRELTRSGIDPNDFLIQFDTFNQAS